MQHKKFILFLALSAICMMPSVNASDPPAPKTNLLNNSHKMPDTSRTYQHPGIENNLPVFYDKVSGRLTFPMSWLSGNYVNFSNWKKEARKKVLENLLYSPPPVPFEPVVIGEEDRGDHIAQKVVLNISADSRILGYLAIPKGEGPFPAVLLFHDHGARFDIGKEKVIRPFNVPEEKSRSAQEWVDQHYGERFIGDELAKRGYVYFATDMLNWSDREGGSYEGQQAIAGNMMLLGASYAGIIAYEDMRAAEFLAHHPKTDPEKIATMGHSVGSYRSWQTAALSDHVKAGVAVCWMASLKSLVVPGNNVTRGGSAYTMLHPNLPNYLDFPDIASLACPKPMMFFNGLQDKLFPVPSVKNAYQKMHKVWSTQNADDQLVTRLWDDPHIFHREMQEVAFDWLDEKMK